MVSNPSCSSEKSICNWSSLLKELTPLSARLGLPIAAIEAIARKAFEIIGIEGGIVLAPGQPTALMVLSKTSKRPHLVIRKKNGGLACDKDCPQYASAGFCSHVVAAAQHDNQLPKLVASYQSIKHGPNLMKLATCDMPKGRGRKGSKGPAKRKRQEAIEIRYELDTRSSGSSFSPVTVTCGANASASVVNTAQPPSPYPLFPPSQVYYGVPGPSLQSPIIYQGASPGFQSPQMYQSVSSSSFQSPQMYQGVACSSFQSPKMYKGVAGSSFQSPHMYQDAGPSFVQQPFRICFVTGNISVCNGCKGKYHKESGPPHDLCMQHEEWRTFTSSGPTTQQSRFGNVYLPLQCTVYMCSVALFCTFFDRCVSKYSS